MVIQALSAYPECPWHVAAPDSSTVNPVLVSDQIAWASFQREGFRDLLRDPLRRGMPRHVDPDEFAPGQPDDHQNIKLNKADGRHHEQTHRGDLRRVVAQERAPPLAG
jgi:hypothetical protein